MLTCDRSYNTFDLQKKNIELKIKFVKTSKINKSLKIKKRIKNNQNFGNFLLKYKKKTFNYFAQKSKTKNHHVFLGAFTCNHPKTPAWFLEGQYMKYKGHTYVLVKMSFMM